MKTTIQLLLLISITLNLGAQNSMTGDGFGGRLWYQPVNYTVGSYSAYTVCGDDKQLYGWGQNSYNQLGYTGISYSVIPVKATGMTKVKYYSTGYLMAAIKEDYSGWVWGKLIPEGIKVIDDIKFVDAGANSCAFVKNDGTVWSVGACHNGEFGNGSNTQQFSTTPAQMLNITNAVRTAQGMYNTAVLLNNGEVMCAGCNILGGLGNGTNADFNNIATSPVKVSILADIIDIKANTFGFIALDKNGDVWEWGNVLQGGTLTTIPQKISLLKNIVAISGCNDGFHFLALDDKKNCYAWLDNTAGQCGDGTNVAISSPKIVATDVIDIMAGEWFSYIAKTDGSLWASGFSGFIWLDIPQQQRSSFTQLHPTHPSIGLCEPVSYSGELGELFIDSSRIPIPHTVYFPNAFTPNNDNINNSFKAIVKPEVVIENFSLIVTNRWGQILFKTNDIDKGWNGKYLNQEAETGTYFFYAAYNQPNRITQSIKGDITLLR